MRSIVVQNTHTHKKRQNHNLRREICRSCRCHCGIRRESSLPNSAFMTEERSDPLFDITQSHLVNHLLEIKWTHAEGFHYQSPVIPSLSIGLLSANISQPNSDTMPGNASRFFIFTFTCWYDVVLIIIHDGGKAQMSNRPRMTVTCQRHHFGGLCVFLRV